MVRRTCKALFPTLPFLPVHDHMRCGTCRLTFYLTVFPWVWHLQDRMSSFRLSVKGVQNVKLTGETVAVPWQSNVSEDMVPIQRIGNPRQITVSIARLSVPQLPLTGCSISPNGTRSPLFPNGELLLHRFPWKMQSVIRSSSPEHLTAFAATRAGSSSRVILLDSDTETPRPESSVSTRPPNWKPSWRQTICRH